MQTSRADGAAGFTLVELLAVLAILAFAGLAVLQAGRGSVEAAGVRAFMIEAEALFRSARVAAIEGGRTQDVVIDTEDRSLTMMPGGRSVAVPRAIALEAKIGAPGGMEKPAIRFFPEGGSSGGTLSFRYRGQDYEIRVNWLTGRADARRS